jgi:hypothetical protein
VKHLMFNQPFSVVDCPAGVSARRTSGQENDHASMLLHHVARGSVGGNELRLRDA